MAIGEVYKGSARIALDLKALGMCGQRDLGDYGARVHIHDSKRAIPEAER